MDVICIRYWREVYQSLRLLTAYTGLLCRRSASALIWRSNRKAPDSPTIHINIVRHLYYKKRTCRVYSKPLIFQIRKPKNQLIFPKNLPSNVNEKKVAAEMIDHSLGIHEVMIGHVLPYGMKQCHESIWRQRLYEFRNKIRLRKVPMLLPNVYSKLRRAYYLVLSAPQNSDIGIF